ncbi:hypothetical protein [Actinomadura algeriensis]|uniref:DUF4179 domain-containing protein n=1 Tax=Actinomadura algeriensis TaxID=1679523 RepID=A0ABR9JIW7_9ACTN|nr:hypothetical protein [Actinomadura algeriensis]MBE1530494.1 hypothetical protein [Actinomadura algeriensis]
MDHDDEDARRLLSALRDAEPESTTAIDVADAMRVGRRRARGRRFASGVTVAGVVAVVAIVSTLLGRTMPPEETPPAAPPNQFGVTHQFFRVGSAGGFTPESYETGRYRQRAHLRLADQDGPRRADGLVTMFPRDRLVDRDGRPWAPDGARAPDVNGHRAFWLDTPVIRAGAIEVAWEWAPGAWGFASVRGDGVDRTQAHRVAQSVLPNGGITVRAPVTVPPSVLGERNRLIGTVASAATPGTRPSVALRFGPKDPPARIGGGEPGWIAIGVERPAPELRTDTTVGDRPAAVDDTGVTVRESADTAFFAEVSGASMLASFGGAERLRDLAAAVTMVPGTAWPPPVRTGCDSSQWPTPGCTTPSPG